MPLEPESIFGADPFHTLDELGPTPESEVSRMKECLGSVRLKREHQRMIWQRLHQSLDKCHRMELFFSNTLGRWCHLPDQILDLEGRRLEA